MARPTYTPPPVGGPPTVGDPDFAAKADAYLGWFPTHGTFSNNLADWMQNEFFADLVDGTAALPAVRFKNDSNTGFYRVGADQLAFSEGGIDQGRIYGRKNVLGTASQSAGIPTGAIIERGSNANGQYVRFADGTQICNRIVNFDGLSITNVAGSNYMSAASSYTMPAAFAGGQADFVSASLMASGTAAIRNHGIGARLRYASSTFTADWTNLVVIAGSSITGVAGETTQVLLHAVGRWF